MEWRLIFGQKDEEVDGTGAVRTAVLLQVPSG